MSDHPAIDGHWQIVSAELAGEKMPDLVTHKIELELARGTYTVRFNGEVADQGTYAAGAHPTAAALTLKGVAGTNAGRTIPSIYRFDGPHLHICYGLDGIIPTAFVSPSGTALFLATYRRRPTPA